MHPDVRKLLDLQEIDQEVSVLRRDLNSLPQEEARRQQRLDDLNQVRAEQRTALDKAEVRSRALEKSIQQADEEVKKLEVRLNGVRNNAEYQATLLQIESVKRESDTMQEEGLALLDHLEGQGADLQEAETAANAEEAVFTEFQEEAAELRRKSQIGLDEVMQRRKPHSPLIQKHLLILY